MAIKTPSVGDTIYVPTALYVGHGKDDIAGGKATVSEVECEGKYVWVSVSQLPGRKYNWYYLDTRQEELKAKYGESAAHPDPDYG